MKSFMLVPALLLASCAYIFHPKWASLIRQHGPAKYPYKAGVLHNVEIPEEVFARPSGDSCCSPCETYDVLDSIKPGKSAYRIVYKNYLGEGGESEPNDIIEYALIRIVGDSLLLENSVFIHDWNELPHNCYLLNSVSIGEQEIHFKGIRRGKDSIEKKVPVVFKDSLSLSDILTERSRFKKISRDAIRKSRR